MAISRRSYPDPSTTVPVAFIAVAGDFPDALAGGAQAGLAPAPLLLTGTNAIPDLTRQELERLNPSVIIILGGTAAVSGDVAEELGVVIREDGRVLRAAGADRFETAERIADLYDGPNGTVFIATAADFPDALAGVPAAVVADAPLLLVSESDIPGPTDAALQRLKPGRIVVLGGENVISQAVSDRLRGYIVAQS